MKKIPLHITNGSNLTEYLKDLGVEGEFLTWHEILCEGPTVRNIDSDEFVEVRRSFLNEFYNIEIDEYEFKKEMYKLDDVNNNSEIVLWFEYDLFCHINLVGVISLLKQKNIDLPLYLVCSGRIKEAKELKGLSELLPEQLLQHYKEKLLLTEDDVDIATSIWDIYCGKDHNLLKPYIVKTSSFRYMNSCLKAHLKRFPDSKNGLCTIEHNILTLVKENEVKSKHHLLGYILNYQGYYGFGDIQLTRMINKLDIFFIEEEHSLKLNRKGHEALLNHHNYAEELNNEMTFGGVKRLHYNFSTQQNKLIKSKINAY